MAPARSLRRSRTRRGTVAVLVAVSLTVLVAVTAIALDGGLLLDSRRRAQAGADAAALAAAADLFKQYPVNGGTDPGGTAQHTAKSTAAANGFQDGDGDDTVTVNIPPASGPFAGQAGYVE